ncbi:hypothetical protein [Micromonospora sp. NBC_01813]|uniref:hypothetical protein n=1 Tax=Micromonospora sp. NBC_01813 TaxID=2975988 RepID=UPI002DDBF6CF|nr:hypothetical protein [Micromonospora sp. NBC_01813]WSA11512.1 hypothetical protein OG958_12440 [Micromonospora sp. NBC_01813]
MIAFQGKTKAHFEEDFVSVKAAAEYFRRRLNGRGAGGLPSGWHAPNGRPLATMFVYRWGNYDSPIATFDAGRKRNGEWTVRRVDATKEA